MLDVEKKIEHTTYVKVSLYNETAVSHHLLNFPSHLGKVLTHTNKIITDDMALQRFS